MDPDVTWGNGSGCHLVMHYWADLQAVHKFHCYVNIVPNAKCQRVLVLAPWLVRFIGHLQGEPSGLLPLPVLLFLHVNLLDK